MGRRAVRSGVDVAPHGTTYLRAGLVDAADDTHARGVSQALKDTYDHQSGLRVQATRRLIAQQKPGLADQLGL